MKVFIMLSAISSGIVTDLFSLESSESNPVNIELHYKISYLSLFRFASLYPDIVWVKLFLNDWTRKA